MEVVTNGIANASVSDEAANPVAESHWDLNNGMSASQEWVDVKVPRDPAETESGLNATPAADTNKQSWADDHPEPAQEVCASALFRTIWLFILTICRLLPPRLILMMASSLCSATVVVTSVMAAATSVVVAVASGVADVVAVRVVVDAVDAATVTRVRLSSVALAATKSRRTPDVDRRSGLHPTPRSASPEDDCTPWHGGVFRRRGLHSGPHNGPYVPWLSCLLPFLHD